ncbi:hypothetical protein ESCO_001500 [Escovopsis weberi]|uniref:N-acetyltransferase domain-containing protein n=1 Tax=Escovopsis weberi TaxID=150374 RepID=A0A0N0RTY6_ESCWE|nr:hypothetical protein ESCO_001500 [Escovopsis weberi]
MSQHAFTLDAPPAWLIALLGQHLPHSATLLTRLQLSQLPNGRTATARVLFASPVPDLAALSDASRAPAAFTAAYLDFGEAPETEMFLYSTLEDGAPPCATDAGTDADTDTDMYAAQLQALIDAAARVQAAQPGGSRFGNKALLGSLNTATRRVLEGMRRCEIRPFGTWDKWLFEEQRLPDLGDALPEGMFWDEASREDLRVFLARGNIPRSIDTMVRLPSLVIKLEDKTPIAWALLGLDGALCSLFCEEAYRGRGLSKKLAAKLLRDNAHRYAQGARMSSDVASSNHASRGICKALNGVLSWEVAWVYLFLD